MLRAGAITLAIFLLLVGSFSVGAGRLPWLMAWAVFGVYIAFKLAAFIFVDPDLLRERAAPGPGMDRGDALIAALGYLFLFPGLFFVAGLDAGRYGPDLPLPLPIRIAALLIYILGNGLAFWAVLANPFFSTIVRIQAERDHVVVSSGPYGRVRHPGYAGALLAHLALPFALNAVWALAPWAIGAFFFVVRTAREDHTLRDRLPGYSAYQNRVRWRLLPGVW